MTLWLTNWCYLECKECWNKIKNHEEIAKYHIKLSFKEQLESKNCWKNCNCGWTNRHMMTARAN